jgi:hypothetical protein
VLAFPDKDVLDALATISTKRPSRVVLERQFASSSRGTALVNRIKADPALASVVVEVVTRRRRDDEPATDGRRRRAPAHPGTARYAARAAAPDA